VKTGILLPFSQKIAFHSIAKKSHKTTCLFSAFLLTIGSISMRNTPLKNLPENKRAARETRAALFCRKTRKRLARQQWQ
jgi:hypothetical protein